MTDIHFTLLDLGKKIRLSSVHDIIHEFNVKRATMYLVPSSHIVEYIVHHPVLVFLLLNIVPVYTGDFPYVNAKCPLKRSWKVIKWRFLSLSFKFERDLFQTLRNKVSI
jgi:hypothetical protein